MTVLDDSAVGFENDSKSAGAPAKEIEVTPEMIEAGESAAWSFFCGSDLHPSLEVDALAKAVFLEMEKARRLQTSQANLARTEKRDFLRVLAVRREWERRVMMAPPVMLPIYRPERRNFQMTTALRRLLDALPVRWFLNFPNAK